MSKVTLKLKQLWWVGASTFLGRPGTEGTKKQTERKTRSWQGSPAETGCSYRATPIACDGITPALPLSPRQSVGSSSPRVALLRATGAGGKAPHVTLPLNVAVSLARLPTPAAASGCGCASARARARAFPNLSAGHFLLLHEIAAAPVPSARRSTARSSSARLPHPPPRYCPFLLFSSCFVSPCID